MLNFGLWLRGNILFMWFGDVRVLEIGKFLRLDFDKKVFDVKLVW